MPGREGHARDQMRQARTPLRGGSRCGPRRPSRIGKRPSRRDVHARDLQFSLVYDQKSWAVNHPRLRGQPRFDLGRALVLEVAGSIEPDSPREEDHNQISAQQLPSDCMKSDE